jgi:hypothetical protein
MVDGVRPGGGRAMLVPISQGGEPAMTSVSVDQDYRYLKCE